MKTVSNNAYFHIGKKATTGTGYGKFTCMYRVMDLLTNEQENSSNASNACMPAEQRRIRWDTKNVNLAQHTARLSSFMHISLLLSRIQFLCEDIAVAQKNT